MQVLQAPTMVAHGNNAYTDLQAALDAAAAGAEIRVASGTYKPTAAPDGSTMITETKPFTSIKTSF